MKQIKKVILTLIAILLLVNVSFSLPVELSFFTSSVNNNNVTLQWGTAAEVNNSGFHVERKKADSTNWTEIGFVIGNGTTNKPHNYIFNDNGLSIGRYNYRLKQEDFNMMFVYYQLGSEVVIDPPLPVELSSFVSVINRNNVTLNWATVIENNNSGFDIERSLTGSKDWTKVGSVAGNGTTNETKHYTFTDSKLQIGVYNYRLKQIDYNGNYEFFNLSNEVNIGLPSSYNLSQNYPNPFNPSTKIDYDLPYDGKVSIVLYDAMGREVANFINEVKTAGYYTVQVNAGNLSSGMYFYRITVNNFASTKKLMLVK